jgi:hypothetical protein
MIHDLTTEFVTHDDVPGRIQAERSVRASKRVSELIGMLNGVEITAADATCESPDENLAITRFRCHYVIDNERFVTQYRSAHRVLSPQSRILIQAGKSAYSNRKSNA